jgi:hypothetical protein
MLTLDIVFALQPEPRVSKGETMIVEYYRDLNAELACEFTLFTSEHPKWLDKNIPDNATVVMQTNDPGNAWTRQVAEQSRSRDENPGLLVLVHIREIKPKKSRIVRVAAEQILPAGPAATRQAG